MPNPVFLFPVTCDPCCTVGFSLPEGARVGEGDGIGSGMLLHWPVAPQVPRVLKQCSKELGCFSVMCVREADEATLAWGCGQGIEGRVWETWGRGQRFPTWQQPSRVRRSSESESIQ